MNPWQTAMGAVTLLLKVTVILPDGVPFHSRSKSQPTTHGFEDPFCWLHSFVHPVVFVIDTPLT